MARPITRNYVSTNCDYCGKELFRVPTRNNHFYCDRFCYSRWMSEKRPESEKYKIHSKESLIDEVKRIASLYDHTPSFSEFTKSTKICSDQFRKHLGSWQEIQEIMGYIPDYSNFGPTNISAHDGGWLSGIIDGEGCFRLQCPTMKKKTRSYSPLFLMSLRDDDELCLMELKRIIGTNIRLHKCTYKSTPNHNPAFKISISDLPTLKHHLIPILETYPLRSKKKYELQVFKFACNILYEKRMTKRINRYYTVEEDKLLSGCYYSLMQLKSYNSDKLQILKDNELPENIFDLL